MIRYALFTFDRYYPCGGASDLRKLFLDQEYEVIGDFIRQNRVDLDEWYQVYDLVEQKIIHYGEIERFIVDNVLETGYESLERGL